MALHPVLEQVTARIIKRSRPSRGAYLAHLEAARIKGRPQRGSLSCTNLAHGFAAFPQHDKLLLKEVKNPPSRSCLPTTTCCRRTSRSSTSRR